MDKNKIAHRIRHFTAPLAVGLYVIFGLILNDWDLNKQFHYLLIYLGIVAAGYGIAEIIERS